MEQLRDCPICGDAVTGFHYGVQTCESCKGFFKRTVQNKKEFKCLRNNDCEVILATRKKCPACRFLKCCEVGMRVEGIREDRSRGGRSTYEGASAFIHRRFKRLSESSDYPTPGGAGGGVGGAAHQKKMKYSSSVIEGQSPEQPLHIYPEVPTLLQQIVDLEDFYEEVTLTPQPCCVNRMTDGDTNKFNSMLHMTEHRLYQIVRWARHLPNFLNIHTQDQILLLQNAWAELTSIGVIWRSRHTPGIIQLSYGKHITLERAKEMDHEEVICRMLYVVESFIRLKVDQYEYVALKVLALMLPDIKGLEKRDIVQQYQSTLLDALKTYTITNYPQFPLKFGELLLRLSEVQRLTALSRQQMLHLQSPELEENSLLMELLRHQSFGKAPQLSDERALHVINSNYQREHITPLNSHPFPLQPAPRVTSLPRTPSHGIAIVAPTTASKNSSAGASQEPSHTVTSHDLSTYPVGNDFAKEATMSSSKQNEGLIPQLVHDAARRTAQLNAGKFAGMSDNLSHLSQPSKHSGMSDNLSHLSQQTLTPASHHSSQTVSTPGPFSDQQMPLSQYHRNSVDRNSDSDSNAISHQSSQSHDPQQISPPNSRVPMNLSNHRHSIEEDMSYAAAHHRKQSSHSQNSPHSSLLSRQESISSQHHINSHAVATSQLSRHDRSTPHINRHDSIVSQHSPQGAINSHELASTAHMLEKSALHQLRFGNSKMLVEPASPLLNSEALSQHQAAQDYINQQQHLLNLSRARAGLSLEQTMTLERLKYNDRFLAERIMMGSPVGTELFAQQYQAALSAAASLPSQTSFDGPQDFSMNRLSHNFDPGVS